MNDQQLLRYSRQIMLPEIDAAGQNKLADACVLIVGLGGLGSPVCMYLASAGVGKLVLVDIDTVDLSNLQRQIIHSTEDIGRKKIDSARERLQTLNPETNIITIDHPLEGAELENQTAQADAVVDASDNFKTRFALNAACVRTKTPLISGAAIRFEGQLSVFNPADPDSPCYRCLYDEDTAVEETCTANGVIAPLPGIIGSIQASETLKILMGIGETLQGKLLLIDCLNMEFHQAKLDKDPACPVCSRQKPQP